MVCFGSFASSLLLLGVLHFLHRKPIYDAVETNEFQFISIWYWLVLYWQFGWLRTWHSSNRRNIFVSYAQLGDFIRYAWWLYDFECFVRFSGPQPCGRNCFSLMCVALEFVPHELSIKLSRKLPCSRPENDFCPVHSSSIFQFSLDSLPRLEVFHWTQQGVFWRRWRVCRLLTTSSFQKLWCHVSFFVEVYVSLQVLCLALRAVVFLHLCPSQANDVRRANPGAAALYEWALARPGKWLKSLLLRLLTGSI